MTTRADLIETAYAAYMAHRPVYSLETSEVDACTCGQRLGPDGWHRHSLTAALDTVLPQITTAEQLEALPAGSWLMTDDGEPLLWDAGLWDRGGPLNPKYYLPLTVVWQPQPEQETADA